MTMVENLPSNIKWKKQILRQVLLAIIRRIVKHNSLLNICINYLCTRHSGSDISGIGRIGKSSTESAAESTTETETSRTPSYTPSAGPSRKSTNVPSGPSRESTNVLPAEPSRKPKDLPLAGTSSSGRSLR